MRTRRPEALPLALAALGLAGCGGEERSSAAGCDLRKELYGRQLEIRVVGKPIACSEVERVIAGECRDGKKWSCFSFRPPDPMLVWFLERERFKPGPDDFSTAIEARRYPCSEARVTRAGWRRAERSFERFPTEQQLLADDIARCGLLRGMTRRQVERLLGRTDGFGDEPNLNYIIGPQRDSFFQLDSEFLSIEFRRDGTYRRAEFFQG
ncbi:MAG: hypothetical protein M3340_06570 [Actinomycetota bacterium]|nr:hypothetical protein [Actinomycetota bacterium]